MSTRIVEVISRSLQGVTRPFLCRGDDVRQYFVKGNGAGRKALISEWIAGNLGLRLGLPIPSFRFVTIPKELIEFSARQDIHELGAGAAFGSERIENADELTYLFIGQIDRNLRARVLLFDWWTANADRTLTEQGGNPNLLWVHRDHRPFVIDHNLAFDEQGMDGFWDTHIFRENALEWNASFRAEMEDLMRSALKDLPDFWRQMPELWTEGDAGLSLSDVEKILWRFDREKARFWRVP